MFTAHACSLPPCTAVQHPAAQAAQPAQLRLHSACTAPPTDHDAQAAKAAPHGLPVKTASGEVVFQPSRKQQLVAAAVQVEGVAVEDSLHQAAAQSRAEKAAAKEAAAAAAREAAASKKAAAAAAKQQEEKAAAQGQQGEPGVARLRCSLHACMRACVHMHSRAACRRLAHLPCWLPAAAAAAHAAPPCLQATCRRRC